MSSDRPLRFLFASLFLAGMEAFVFGAIATEAHITPGARIVFGLIVEQPPTARTLAQPR